MSEDLIQELLDAQRPMAFGHHSNVLISADNIFVRAAAALKAKGEECERLTVENWQLKGALGYPVPGHIHEGNFQCGLCKAKTASLIAAESSLSRMKEALADIVVECIDAREEGGNESEAIHAIRKLARSALSQSVGIEK